MDVKDLTIDTVSGTRGGVVARAYTNGTDKNTDRVRGTWFSNFNNNITRKSTNRNGNGPGIIGRDIVDTIKSFGGTWIGNSRVEYEDRVTEESNTTCNVYKDYYSVPSNIKDVIYKQFKDVRMAWDIWHRTEKEKRWGIQNVRNYDKDSSGTSNHLENIQVCIKETYRITPAGRTLIKSEITKLIYVLVSVRTNTTGSSDDNTHHSTSYTVTEINPINNTSKTITNEYDHYSAGRG